MSQENMLCFFRPAHIASLKIKVDTRFCSIDETSLQIAMVPARLHALSRLVAESVPSMELFAVGLAGRWPKPNWTHWTRIRLNGDNQRVVEIIAPTTGEEALARISSRFYESVSGTG